MITREDKANAMRKLGWRRKVQDVPWDNSYDIWQSPDRRMLCLFNDAAMDFVRYTPGGRDEEGG